MAEGTAAATGVLSTLDPLDVRLDAPPPDAGREAQAIWLDTAAACVRQHGLVVIGNAIPAAVIAGVLDDFKRRHAVHMTPGQQRLFRNFQTDPLRAQVPVAIDGAVADPAVFAAPAVLALARRMMGDDVIVGECGVVISHAGAGPQNTHRDSAFLYGGLDQEIGLPPFSMTLLLPLIDVSLGMGPTEFWPGTQRVVDETRIEGIAPLALPLSAGTALLLDSRMLHRGGANATGPVRPSLYFSYHRPWYLENSGYETKPQVRITPRMLARLPEAHRPLFAWALHLNRVDTVEEFLFRWIGRLRAMLRRFRGG